MSLYCQDCGGALSSYDLQHNCAGGLVMNKAPDLDRSFVHENPKTKTSAPIHQFTCRGCGGEFMDLTGKSDGVCDLCDPPSDATFAASVADRADAIVDRFLEGVERLEKLELRARCDHPADPDERRIIDGDPSADEPKGVIEAPVVRFDASGQPYDRITVYKDSTDAP